MKKIVSLLLISVLLICFTFVLSYAETPYPLEGPEWEGKSSGDLHYLLYEQGFVDLYQITEADVNSERAFRSFRQMRLIFAINKLGRKHENNEIQSQELKQILDVLIPAAKNPQTAKDYFYRGIFSAKSEPSYSPLFEDMLDPFIHIIENFPDTVYAEYSYILLARNYWTNSRYTEAADTYNSYISKYGANGKVTFYAYYGLAFVYRSLTTHERRKVKDGDQAKINIFLSNANKIITDYPDRKKEVRRMKSYLGGFYKNYQKDYDKALTYYNDVYNDPEITDNDIIFIFSPMTRIYIRKKNYSKVESLLTEIKTRYPQSNKLRRKYKDSKLYLKENQLFDYDRYDEIGNKSMPKAVLSAKRAQVSNYKATFEQELAAEWPEPPLSAYETEVRRRAQELEGD